LVNESVVQQVAAHVRYVNLSLHGYYVLDVNTSRTQADYVFVSTITSHTYNMVQGPSWYVNNGERFLRQASSPSVAATNYPVLAPGNDVGTGIRNLTDNVTTISIYPNPFYNQVIIQYNTFVPEPITLEVWGADGKLVLQTNLGVSNKGINYAQFNGSNLPSGFYRVRLIGKSEAHGETMIKFN
jgi:alkaline phosphatase D